MSLWLRKKIQALPWPKLKPIPYRQIPILFQGIRLGTARSGEREQADITVIEAVAGSQTAAVFTRNLFQAAPVHIARQHLESQSEPRYCLINAGNANAATGERGLRDCLRLCDVVATTHGVPTESVLPFSTGIIGSYLPMEALEKAVPVALSALRADGWNDGAQAIMTTDRQPKLCSGRLTHNGHTITVTGIAKGAGMICPDMATMLAFIATDACASRPWLQDCLLNVTEQTFNRITVDGDTSTNDAAVLIASQQSQCPSADQDVQLANKLTELVKQVSDFLAQEIVRDGEGATKMLKIQVNGGRDEQECSQVARTIAHSPLVKSSLYGCLPNWGRIWAAIGRAGLMDLRPEQVEIRLFDQLVLATATPHPEFDPEKMAQAMANHTVIPLNVRLNRGEAEVTILTSDIGHDYITLNSEKDT